MLRLAAKVFLVALLCVAATASVVLSPDEFFTPQAVLAIGATHACAVGQGDVAPLYCWGDDTFGQQQVARQLKSQKTGSDFDEAISQVVAGDGFTCALTNASRVVCAGDNRHGQVQVPNGIHASKVVAGQKHVCALLDDFSVTCWGTIGEGQGPQTAVGPFMDVAVGAAHTCALRRADHTLQCWGVGISASVSSTKFERVWSQFNRICGLLPSRDLLCWTTDGSATETISGPVLAAALGVDVACVRRATLDGSEWKCSVQGSDVGGLAVLPSVDGGFTSVAMGVDSACAITRATAALVCWGPRGGLKLNGPFGFAPTPATSKTNGASAASILGRQSSLRASSYHAAAAPRVQSTSDPFRYNFSQATVCTSEYYGCALNSSAGANMQCWTLSGVEYTSGQPYAHFISLSCSYAYTCGLTQNGEIYCWNIASSVKMYSQGPYSSISAAYYNRVCATNFGSVICWNHDGSTTVIDTGSIAKVGTTSNNGLCLLDWTQDVYCLFNYAGWRPGEAYVGYPFIDVGFDSMPSWVAATATQLLWFTQPATSPTATITPPSGVIKVIQSADAGRGMAYMDGNGAWTYLDQDSFNMLNILPMPPYSNIALSFNSICSTSVAQNLLVCYSKYNEQFSVQGSFLSESDVYCLNGGTSVVSGSSASCVCLPNTSGVHCETAIATYSLAGGSTANQGLLLVTYPGLGTGTVMLDYQWATTAINPMVACYSLGLANQNAQYRAATAAEQGSYTTMLSGVACPSYSTGKLQQCAHNPWGGAWNNGPAVWLICA